MNSFVKNPISIKKVLKIKKIPTFRKFERVCKFVTKRMMKIHRLKSPFDINQGYCFMWSYLVHALWHEPLQFVSTDSHVVILNNRLRKYYDSENLEGTDDVDEIAGMGGDRERSVVDRQIMTFFWAHAGKEKNKFRDLIKEIDPDDLVVRCGKPYYKQEDTYDLEISDAVADVTRLNAGV